MEPAAIADLLRALARQGYDFVTPTPATHERVLRARREPARDLRDVFGWSLPFAPGLLGAEIAALVQAGGLAEETPGGLKARLRVSSLDGLLLAHSPFPTEAEDAVFFGPDSYRFAAFIDRHLPRREGLEIIDLGAGAGVGGLAAARRAPRSRVILTDINPAALDFARANALAARLEAATVRASGLKGLGDADVILANPPYMLDEACRTYRDGGGELGEAVSLDWAREALDHLRPGGRLILYTGVAIRDGCDVVREGLEALEARLHHYEEIDPDVFGEELAKPAYAGVERIAVVGAVMGKPA